MATLKYPSDFFPGSPSVQIDIPDDWVPRRIPGTAIAAQRARDDGAFIPNAIVRLSTRPVEDGPAEVIDELRHYIGGKDRGVVSNPFQVDLQGRTFVGCDVSWVGERDVTIVQAHLFTGISLPGGTIQGFVQLTGSVGGAQAKQDYPIVRDVLATVQVLDVWQA